MPATRDTNSDVDTRARTWLEPDQVEALRDVRLTDAVPAYRSV
jgi:hypothetical protein